MSANPFVVIAGLNSLLEGTTYGCLEIGED